MKDLITTTSTNKLEHYNILESYKSVIVDATTNCIIDWNEYSKLPKRLTFKVRVL